MVLLPSMIRPSSTLRFVACALIVLLASSLSNSTTVHAQSRKGGLSDGPKTISSKEKVSILINREIDGTKSFIVLKISVPNDSKINAFLLSAPPRLVVDFEGASIKKSEDLQAPENGVIKQIRLGAHPTKLRVVVDLVKSTPPEYEWKAGKRQAIIKILEGEEPAAPAPTTPPAAPTIAPTVQATSTATKVATIAPALPTAAPSITPTIQSQPTKPAVTPTSTTAPTMTVTLTPAPALTATPVPTSIPTTPPTVVPTETSKPTLSDMEGAAGIAGAAPVAGKGAPQQPALPDYQTGAEDSLDDVGEDLGDIEDSKPAEPQPKVPTTFSIKGYKFERLPDKSPVLKILLNKPRAQAQISKVDEETYKIEIKDCGLDNEDLELPQFPPHDFVGFVMVVAEPVGKNTEISVSVENEIVLATSVHDQEIWVKKP